MSKAVFGVVAGSATFAMVAVMVMVATTLVAFQTIDHNSTTGESELYHYVDPDRLVHYTDDDVVLDAQPEEIQSEVVAVEYMSALDIQREILQGIYDYADENFAMYYNWLSGMPGAPSIPADANP